MYRVTGNEKYLKLAKYFLDLRGLKGVMRKEYSQTNKPVIMQDEAVGHAVRAAYMYSGMADVAAIMGDKSKGYMVVKRLWKEGDVVSFELPMEVHKTIAHENVADDKGKMELERGPIVYCIESPDNSNIASSYITEQAVATPVWTDDMNGLMKLNVENQNSFNGIDHLVAIPYYAWANRGKSLMKV